MKKIIIMIILITSLLLTGCGSSETTEETSGYDLSYSDRDKDPSYKKSTSVLVTLDDNNIDVKGNGAEANDSVLTINSEGTYVLSGSLDDGQIIIDAPNNEKVQIVLNGVTVSSSQSAPLNIKEADKVFITLAEDSTNIFSGSASASEESAENNVDGVIFSKADLCINGSGALKINAPSCHGIVSKDDLIITGGTLTVTAAGDGLQGKDCVKINDGCLDITAANDGIRSTNSEKEYRGFIYVDGGRLSIDAGYDGLQAETLLQISGGKFDIITGGGSQNASTDDNWTSGWGSPERDNMNGPGNPGGPGSFASHNESEEGSDTVSAKGLKAGLELKISDGNLNIDSSDDALHSNGSMLIENGHMVISSGDDGAHTDSELLVAGGTLNISKSYEGLEGNSITINSGNIVINASDDGLNAAGGSDGSALDRPGAGEFSADETAFINIAGGNIDITASGDGIDSNGSLEITDGSVTVTCPTTGDTAVLDYASTGHISGGTFIGTGAVQMAMTFSSSNQGVISVNVGNQSSSTPLTLEDSDGNTIITHRPSKDYAIAIISSPDITSGKTYTISVGNDSGEITAE